VHYDEPKKPTSFRTACEHLDRYLGHLFAAPEDPCRERTTNGLESWWGDGKRRCRRRHGRKKLTREFRSLPAEFMLLANLENPQYADLVLNGELNNLARKLADAGRTAGPWTAWRAAQQPLNVGRLPMRLLRHDNFLEELTAVYDVQNRLDGPIPMPGQLAAVADEIAGQQRAHRLGQRRADPRPVFFMPVQLRIAGQEIVDDRPGAPAFVNHRIGKRHLVVVGVPRTARTAVVPFDPCRRQFRALDALELPGARWED
jgi:hypothetical protein